jgi:type VI secretion system secreted protein VgrG
VAGLSGHEAISHLFHFELELLAENGTDIPFESLLGQSITIGLNLPDEESRPINGICIGVSQGAQDDTFTSYTMEIVPKLWLLTKRAQSRIFQHISVPDILRQVLAGLDVSFELQGTFQPRDYCVQYRETDFNFASRLMEEEGIYYFFKHSQGSHTLVLANTPQSHPELPGDSTLIYELPSGGNWLTDRVMTWEKRQNLRSGKYTLWDHCFELPHKHLEVTKTIQGSVAVGSVTHQLQVGGNGNLEIYDYPGEYAQRFDGVNKGGGDQPADIQNIFSDNQRTTGIRMQEEASPGVVLRATSSYRHLVSGYKFTLDRHFNADGSYVLTAVEHSAKVSNLRSGGGEFHYANSFTALPAGLAFRPTRTAPKPFVQGTQTAVVVGPPGQEIFTDKYGRVKVQFHWDRQGQRNADSSCWVRVAQPWAGKRWGASFWPRIGHEVIVAFQEGDPDQPIIVGSVYNADQMPPYLGQGPDPEHPNDNKLTGVKSNSTLGGVGFNEWRFDDTKGKEQIFVHAEKDQDIRVKNDRREWIGHDRSLIVKHDKKEEVENDKSIFIHKNHDEHIGADMKLLVDQNQDIVIKQTKKELIQQDNHLHVNGNRMQKVDGNHDLTVGGDQSESVQGNDQFHVSKDRKVYIEGNQNLTVGQDQKEMIEGKSHLIVKDDRNEQINGKQSLTVFKDQQEKVNGNHALEAGQEIHLKGGMKIVLEAGMEITLKSPGGFVKIDASGVTIQGILVKINSGGSPGKGKGSSPDDAEATTPPKDAQAPQDAKEAKPKKPDKADDSVTGQKSNTQY